MKDWKKKTGCVTPRLVGGRKLMLLCVSYAYAFMQMHYYKKNTNLWSPIDITWAKSYSPLLATLEFAYNNAFDQFSSINYKQITPFSKIL